MPFNIPRTESPVPWNHGELFFPAPISDPKESPLIDHPCLKGLAEIWNPLSSTFSACCEGQITAKKTYEFFGNYPLVLDSSRLALAAYYDQPLLEKTLSVIRQSFLRMSREYGIEDRRISQVITDLTKTYSEFIEAVEDSSPLSKNAAKRLAQACRKTLEIFARVIQSLQKDLQIIETRTLEWFDISSTKEANAPSTDRLVLYDPFANSSFTFSNKDPDDIALCKKVVGFLHSYSTILNSHREFFLNSLRVLSKARTHVRQLADWAEAFSYQISV